MSQPSNSNSQTKTEDDLSTYKELWNSVRDLTVGGPNSLPSNTSPALHALQTYNQQADLIPDPRGPVPAVYDFLKDNVWNNPEPTVRPTSQNDPQEITSATVTSYHHQPDVNSLVQYTMGPQGFPTNQAYGEYITNQQMNVNQPIQYPMGPHGFPTNQAYGEYITNQQMNVNRPIQYPMGRFPTHQAYGESITNQQMNVNRPIQYPMAPQSFMTYQAYGGYMTDHQMNQLMQYPRAPQRTESVSSSSQRTPKTPCEFFTQNGRCRYGETCKFRHEKVLPSRPGKPACSCYSVTGDCGYGADCIYDHPVLLPQRPGAPVCPFFLKNRVCGYRSSCVYDHPPVPPIAPAPSQAPTSAPEPMPSSVHPTAKGTLRNSDEEESDAE